MKNSIEENPTEGESDKKCSKCNGEDDYFVDCRNCGATIYECCEIRKYDRCYHACPYCGASLGECLMDGF